MMIAVTFVVCVRAVRVDVPMFSAPPRGGRWILPPLFTLVLATGVTALLAAKHYCNPGYIPLPFSTADWATANEERRGHMAEDLLAHHHLVGLSTTELDALLGPADDVIPWEFGPRRRYRLGRMGRNPDCPLTDMSLLIRITAEGIVHDAHLAD